MIQINTANYIYKCLIATHTLKNINKFNIILPIKHYFEETVVFLIFKV